MNRITPLLLTLVLLATPALADSSKKNLTDNEAKCQRFFDEVLSQGNIAVVDELVAANYVEHDPFPGYPADKNGLKQYVKMMRTAFPDLNTKVDFMMNDGDRVAAYLTVTGTHKGQFMGIEPSGKKFSVRCVDIVRIKDGKAVEHWGVFDSAALMQQLGGTPETMKASSGQ